MLASPPVKPRGFSRTTQKGKSHYTIHSKPSDVFTLRTKEDRTAVVSFHRKDDALLMAKMMETYFKNEKSLPSVQTFGREEALYLPKVSDENLEYLYLDENEFDDLKIICTRHFFDMISVEKLKENKDGYSITGNVYKFEAPIEYYRVRLTELFDV